MRVGMRIDAEEAPEVASIISNLMPNMERIILVFQFMILFAWFSLTVKHMVKGQKKIYQALCFVCKNVDPPKETKIDWL